MEQTHLLYRQKLNSTSLRNAVIRFWDHNNPVHIKRNILELLHAWHDRPATQHHKLLSNIYSPLYHILSMQTYLMYIYNNTLIIWRLVNRAIEKRIPQHLCKSRTLHRGKGELLSSFCCWFKEARKYHLVVD